MATIKLDPDHPFRIPTAASDRQVQELIDKAVRQERARCVAVVRDELARWDARRGIGWSWTKVRDNILAAIGTV
jgi:hypothetical protein